MEFNCSIGRQDSDSSTTTVGTPTLSGSCEPIRKSPREVIIPIAVEGGGFVTPSASTLSKMRYILHIQNLELIRTRVTFGFTSNLYEIVI